MRRLTLAALMGTLVLSACSDQRQSPTEPPVLFSKAKCQAPAFPHTTVVAEIKNVFPPGLRGGEVSQSTHIKNDWDACRAGAAQQGVVDFINGMNADFAANRLVGTDAQRNQLITTLLTAVGLASPPSFELGPDFGVGLYDPNQTTPQIFQTAGGTALTELLHGAFSEFTVIVISRRPDGSDPLDFEGNQFPPFFDYNAINASGNHFFEHDLTATIAFCQLPQTEDFQYPAFEDIKIGHNRPEPNPGFEALDPVVREDLANLLNCENLDENIALGNFGGLQRLAHATGRYLAPIARAIFMPTPLQAATTAVGYGGPIATKPGSFSPFGIVEEPTQPIPEGFGSGGWSYKQISNSDPVPSTLTTITPTAADGWATGTAPFGTITTCDLLPPNTPWTLNTTMLLRRDVLIPASTVSADIDILVDNDVQVFVNGWDVSGGLLIYENCAQLHPVHLTLQASSGPATAEAPLVAGQVNKIFIRGVDRGGQSYLDAKMTLLSD